MTLIAVDLCCGAGGLSLGIETAGFSVRAALDIDPKNAEYHHRNFPASKTVCGSITEFTGAQFREVSDLAQLEIDLVFGGPPCQGFSLMGKRDLLDERNGVLLDFARLAMELNPRMILIENVTGLLRGQTRAFADALQSSLETGGYNVAAVWRLNARDYNTPQDRRRIFFIAVRADVVTPDAPPLPAATYTAPTVWDAISDLTVLGPARIGSTGVYRGPLGQPSTYAKSLRLVKEVKGALTCCHKARHSPVVARRFANTAQGSHEPISRFYRLPQEGVAHTIRAGTTSDKGSFMAARPIHPTQPRCITVREAARIQGFPDSFEFHPTRWHGFRQVGNAVPPPLALAVGLQLYKALTNSL